MSRYRVEGPWRSARQFGLFHVMEADIVDIKTGLRYGGGASRVVKAPEMKPAVRGKGGTHPFFGETAWSDAERLALDLAFKEDRRRC